MKLLKSKPDQNIGPDYMHRWYIIPKNPIFNIYFHKFFHSDDDRALHDHPWWSLSILLKGKLIEVTHPTEDTIMLYLVPKFWPVLRSARHAHRLVLDSDEAWTLFITGPKIREWGFHCPKGWVHWRKFVDQEDINKIGRGCD